MKLSGLQLKTQNPEQAIAFYSNIFGMTLINKFEQEGQLAYVLQYPGSDSCLELFHNHKSPTPENYEQDRLDNYWKYSVFVEDIQQSYHFLKNKGILTNEPYQFGDIGYLMHTKDKENYQIEFIQKTFKENTFISSNANVFPINIGEILLGLITIRTKDPVKSIHFFESLLDMKLLVRMYVNRGEGFTLFFLGDKQLNAPNQDIDAIENRKWLYQQSEPFIEIQYYWGIEHQDSISLNANTEKNVGLSSIKFKTKNIEETKLFFMSKNIDYISSPLNLNQTEAIRILSPDKQLIIIEEH